MAFVLLYMWEMWDVTPVTDWHTDGRTVESRTVFSLSWIRNCSSKNCTRTLESKMLCNIRISETAWKHLRDGWALIVNRWRWGQSVSKEVIVFVGNRQQFQRWNQYEMYFVPPLPLQTVPLKDWKIEPWLVTKTCLKVLPKKYTYAELQNEPTLPNSWCYIVVSAKFWEKHSKNCWFLVLIFW